jgi:hypothetical protein
MDRLSVAPDPDLSGAVPGQSPYEVTGILRVDTSRDLAWLSAPGLPACDASPPGFEPLGPGEDEGGVPLTRVDKPLIGIRDRDGYRSRVFRATLERTISIPGEVDLLMIRIPDGGVGRAGFLFDDRHRLFGALLPSAPHSDPALACAVAMTDGSPGIVPPDRTTLPFQEALAETADPFHSTPTGLLSRALLLTRHDQIDRAIGLLDEVAGVIGEFEDLLIERGVRQFTAGRTARAIEDFTRATRLNPGHYLAHYNLGIALGTSGRYLQAADALERALLIDPDHPRALYHLALAHQAARRPERALRDYELLMVQDAGLADELRQILGY